MTEVEQGLREQSAFPSTNVAENCVVDAHLTCFNREISEMPLARVTLSSVLLGSIPATGPKTCCSSGKCSLTVTANAFRDHLALRASKKKP